MNLNISLKIAKILALSSVRARRTQGRNPKDFSKSPMRNLVASGIVFPAITLFTFLVLTRGSFTQDGVELTLSQFLIFLPSFSALLMILNSLMFEFFQSTYAASTDVISWLPVAPTDYVLGSSISMLYFASPIFAIIYGATLGAALAAGMLAVWLFSCVLSIFGAFTGGFAMEILRALMNRASADLYKRNGTGTMVVRLFLTVLLIGAFSLTFNYDVLLKIVGWFAISVNDAWFLPPLWPSMAITSLLQANINATATYTALSIALTLAFFWAGVKARSRYWVPVPVTVKMAPMKTYEPKRGLLGMIGLKPAETAIVRKDFRALIRRREMVTILAVPFIMGLMSFVSFNVKNLWDPSVSTFGKLTFFMQPGMGLTILAFYVGLVGFGQEGSAFINLKKAPLDARSVIRAKMVTALSPSLAILAGLLAVVGLVFRPSWEVMASVSVVGFVTLLEASLMGIVFGTRYPDFTEIPRARFITQQGALLGMAFMVVAIVATITPVLVNQFVLRAVLGLPVATCLTLAIAGVISYICYRSASASAEELYVMGVN
ncbi:MAG: hypothetical protein JRJ78_16445 [Deltaproteobacteria bacterium]|nr:hypothetical protein [Deltaproteobacteria bacterium]